MKKGLFFVRISCPIIVTDQILNFYVSFRCSIDLRVVLDCASYLSSRWNSLKWSGWFTCNWWQLSDALTKAALSLYRSYITNVTISESYVSFRESAINWCSLTTNFFRSLLRWRAKEVILRTNSAKKVQIISIVTCTNFIYLHHKKRMHNMTDSYFAGML